MTMMSKSSNKQRKKQTKKKVTENQERTAKKKPRKDPRNWSNSGKPSKMTPRTLPDGPTSCSMSTPTGNSRTAVKPLTPFSSGTPTATGTGKSTLTLRNARVLTNAAWLFSSAGSRPFHWAPICGSTSWTTSRLSMSATNASSGRSTSGQLRPAAENGVPTNSGITTSNGSCPFKMRPRQKTTVKCSRSTTRSC